MDLTHLKSNLKGDLFGGLAATLVALPSAIAFGLIIFAPLGADYAARGAIGGIMGCIAIGLLAPVFGGTARLISAPCAPAAAVLSVFTMEMVRRDGTPGAIALIPAYLSVVMLLSAGIQILAGALKGGRIIKYIPYPVVAGYLSGVGLLIFTAQLPKLAGMPKGATFFSTLTSIPSWEPTRVAVGAATMAAMILAPRFIKAIPGAIVALVAGVLTYFALTLVDSSLLATAGNPAVIGPILPADASFPELLSAHFSSFGGLRLADLALVLVPAGTLAVLLSVDTLKTCVILDAVTRGRHDSNRELVGQGLGNCASALVMGIPGAGTMGASLVNLTSGGVTRLSGVFVGLFSLLILLFFAGLIAWIPVSALAGILMVVGVRMVDTKSLKMLRSWHTAFDFFVILAVIVAALSTSLLTASGVGVALAIVLFLRDQIRGSVVRRKATGSQISSKMKRLKPQREALEAHGDEIVAFELQGQLFFGTTDQLIKELDPHLAGARYILLDMRRVQSIDYTAVNMLRQVEGRLAEKDGYLLFSSIPAHLPTGRDVKGYFTELGLSAEQRNVRFFDNHDAALEWAEDQLLTRVLPGSDAQADTRLELGEIELLSGIEPAKLDRLRSHVIEKEFAAGETIFARKDPGGEIFLVRSGVVKVFLPLSGGITYHLATFGRGDFFGDMSFLDAGVRSANAAAQTDVSLFVVSRAEFDRLAAEHPEVSAVVFERLALALALRLRQTDAELKALQQV